MIYTFYAMEAPYSNSSSTFNFVGYGTTSTVYALKERTNNMPLACKVIDKKKIALERNYDTILAQLRSEIGVLRQLSHENIVSLRDVIETKQTIYIITEYVPGGELFYHIVENGPLKEEEAKTVMLGVFSAIDYLHEKGIVHRDIKAENILISRKDGEIVNVKLIDFGFSKVIKNNLAVSFLGTGGYIAPEIRQQKQYSKSVDMWACGVLLYATLCGRLPFSPVTDLLPPKLGVHDEEFRLNFHPLEIWDNLGPSVKSLVAGLLKVDPMQRISIKQAMIHPWFGSKKDFRDENNEKSSDYAYSLPQSLSDGSFLIQENFIREEIPGNGNEADTIYREEKFRRLDASGKTGSSFTGSTDSCNTGSSTSDVTSELQ